MRSVMVEPQQDDPRSPKLLCNLQGQDSAIARCSNSRRFNLCHARDLVRRVLAACKIEPLRILAPPCHIVSGKEVCPRCQRKGGRYNAGVITAHPLGKTLRHARAGSEQYPISQDLPPPIPSGLGARCQIPHPARPPRCCSTSRDRQYAWSRQSKRDTESRCGREPRTASIGLQGIPCQTTARSAPKHSPPSAM